MRCGNSSIRLGAACGLTAAALLACAGTVQAQRPGGIGGQAGGSTAAPSGGSGLAASPSAGLTGIGGSVPLGGGPAFNGAGGLGGAGPLAGGALGGSGLPGGASAMAPLSSGYGEALPGGNLSAAPAGVLGGAGTIDGGSGATGAGGSSTRARAGVSPYGALGIPSVTRLAPSGGARGPAVSLAALSPAMEADFRDLASRSDLISPATRDGARFGLDGTTVVLRGRAADEAEALALENLIRFAPGARAVRNEMTWPAR